MEQVRITIEIDDAGRAGATVRTDRPDAADDQPARTDGPDLNAGRAVLASTPDAPHVTAVQREAPAESAGPAMIDDEAPGGVAGRDRRADPDVAE